MASYGGRRNANQISDNLWRMALRKERQHLNLRRRKPEDARRNGHGIMAFCPRLPQHQQR
jgi:hypothetical protein